MRTGQKRMAKNRREGDGGDADREGPGSGVRAPELVGVNALGWTGGLAEPRPEGEVAGGRSALLGGDVGRRL
jgi:hypothetical protein